MEEKRVKLNKTNLKKFMDWSPSRFNEWRKDEAIDYIIELSKKGENTTQKFSIGSWSATYGSQSQFNYIFKIKNGKKTLVKDLGRSRKEKIRLI